MIESPGSPPTHSHPEFKFNPGQLRAQPVCVGPAQHIMLRGGSRSGKTVLHLRNIIIRALKAPGARALILRFRFNHVKQSIGLETMPWVQKNIFPDIQFHLDKVDWFWTLPNGSEIWLGGLDDKERTEKILGKECATAWLNECSQISWDSREIVKTRLAQVVYQDVEGMSKTPLLPRMYYDENPGNKGSWTYKLFEQKRDPITKMLLPDPQNYASVQINPDDNAENLPISYLDSLRNSSARLKKRFYLGEYADDNPYALFVDTIIDQWREVNGNVPDFVRVVVGVDPSGSGDVDNADNDEIGITVGGLGTDGKAYLLEDCTVKAGPGTWGKVSTSAWERHSGDVIVGEKNFGGEMVRFTIQTARPRTPVKLVSASRGKVVRAEPFSSLYEQGKVVHVGNFPQLEDELCAMSTNGYLGQGSPNRADSWIWVLAELFPAIVADHQETKLPPGFKSQYTHSMGIV